MQIEKKLIKRRNEGNERRLQLLPPLIDFASNDYLGIARSDPFADMVLQKFQQQSEKQKRYGSSGSRLLTGHSLFAEHLEGKIAEFHGYEAGLLFNCGYMGNIGLLSAIAGSDDTIYYDAHIHASTQDGIRLSRAKAFPFRHNDLDQLENRLRSNYSHCAKYVCVESIYSTDGTLAPLTELCHLTQKYDAHLIVDEAHAVGISGPKGRGRIAQLQLQSSVFAQVVTFGKALGTYGAIVLGSRRLKELLINFAHSFIYTTAMPLHCLVAIDCSYDYFPTLELQRNQINDLIISSSQSHIQCVKIRGGHEVVQMAKKVALAGFSVSALRSPTVRRGEECLRISLHSFNTQKELTSLFSTIEGFRNEA